MKLDPDFPETYINLAASFFAQGKFRDAEMCYRMAIRKSKKYAEPFFGLATLYLKKGDYIGIKKEEIGISSQGYYSIDRIEAPREIIILKNEVVEEAGGLNSIIEQIKCGNFEFKTSRFINHKARK